MCFNPLTTGMERYVQPVLEILICRSWEMNFWKLLKIFEDLFTITKFSKIKIIYDQT